jgi:hypothetical protein
LEILKFCKCYSVIFNITPDFIHQEQFTVIVRFVFPNENSRKIENYEHFLCSCSVDNITGDCLSTYLVDFLAKDNIDNIDTHNIRGQDYGNGVNVKEINNGVRKIITDLNPRAIFVPFPLIA